MNSREKRSLFHKGGIKIGSRLFVHGFVRIGLALSKRALQSAMPTIMAQTSTITARIAIDTVMTAGSRRPTTYVLMFRGFMAMKHQCGRRCAFLIRQSCRNRLGPLVPIGLAARCAGSPRATRWRAALLQETRLRSRAAELRDGRRRCHRGLRGDSSVVKASRTILHLRTP